MASSEPHRGKRFLLLGWWWLLVLALLGFAVVWVATLTLEARPAA